MPSTKSKPKPTAGAASKRTTKKKSTRKSSKAVDHAKLTKEDMDAMDLPDLWRLYKKHEHPQNIRNYYMEKYLPLVRYNAERIYARLPDEVDIEDLMSAGLFGLMDAINAFQLERGVKFETYCAPRIRGAILDELRSMDWVPRLVRHRSAKVEQSRLALTAEYGRAPTQEEIASRLGVDKEEFKKIDRDSKAVTQVSLSRKCRQSDGSRELREIDVIRDDTQTNPLTETQRRDLRD
ncbi:MAG: sigma-70 family RNA polymerase sigma factor, partial [Planctomycetota bacterium]